MDHRKSLKSGSGKESEVDRISDLPDNLTDQILSCLSIKDAAKTSVLSTKWRYRWESLQSLVLSEHSFPPPQNDQGFYLLDKLLRNIDCLLLLHSGPLLKFELSYFQLSIPNNEINKWIRHVSRHPLREFVFWIPNLEADYNIPPCLFSCQNLTHVNLTNCSLGPPSTFKGFENLKSLYLQSVTVARGVLDCLVSNSPVLEILVLRQINGLSNLNIDAPKLRILRCSGDSFVDIRLKKNAPCLFDFSMDSIIDNENGYHGNFGNLVQLLDNMPRIRNLCIESCAVEYWARGNIPIELPVHCIHLDYLSINVNLTSCDETSALLCLLRSVPNLSALRLSLFDYGARESGSEVWEVDHWNFAFTRLQLIRIEYLDAPEVGADFLRFMLSTTPILERMVFSILNMASDENKYEMVRQLCPFKPLSPTAEVTCQ